MTLSFPRLGIGSTGLAVLLFLGVIFLMSQISGIGGAMGDVTQSSSKVIFTVVIADDQPDELVRTTTAVTTVLSALGFEPRILPAPTYELLVPLAMTGNQGKQVNAVFLDGGYGLGAENWLLPDDLADRFRSPVAAGNTLATILREAGYTGPIILVSGLPSDYTSEPGGENFAADFVKREFWGRPTGALEVIRKIFLP